MWANKMSVILSLSLQITPSLLIPKVFINHVKLTLEQYQSMGYDVGSVVEDMIPVEDIISMAKQLLEFKIHEILIVYLH